MTASSRKPYRQLFANQQFRWLFSGNTVMFFGFFGTILLRSLLAWEITGDEMALAYINLISAACMFATSMVSGVLIDRYERKWFLLMSQFVVFAAEATILALLITGHINFPLLLISSTASSVAFPFIMPSRTAMLVAAVGKPRLAKATAFMTAGINLARMISPAAVGVMADMLGFIFCYSAVLSLHGASLLCTLALSRYPPGKATRESFGREILRGFSYIIERRSIGLCILFGILPLMIAIPLQNLMVVFVDEIWDRGGSGLGIMMAATGIGGVVGSLCMTLIHEGSLVKPMVFGTLVMGVFLLFFAHLPWFWLAVLMVLIIYSASVLSQTLVQTAVQLMAEDYIRGRITTITMMSMSIAPMGTVLIAWSTKKIGAPWTMTLSGVMLIASVVLMWWLVPAFRRIDEVANSYGRDSETSG